MGARAHLTLGAMADNPAQKRYRKTLQKDVAKHGAWAAHAAAAALPSARAATKQNGLFVHLLITTAACMTCELPTNMSLQRARDTATLRRRQSLSKSPSWCSGMK